jgi:hypothetical protein
MKNKRVTKFIALIVGVGLIIGVGSVSRARPSLPAPSLSVSKYGTLLEIVDANGKSRFGKLNGEGFQLSYEFQGKTLSASAIGDAEAVGLVAGDVKTDGPSTTVISETSDHVLEITTYFSVNKKNNKLIIQRKVRNISKEPVVVKAMSEYVDPAFVIGVQNDFRETGEKAIAVLRGKLDVAMIIGDCLPGECPEDPPPCPLPCGARIKFDLARMTIRTDPKSNRPDSLILPAASATTLPLDGAVVQRLFIAFPL